ncbi:MAG: DUF1990 domain-containing protein [Actinomycetota bacterium]
MVFALARPGPQTIDRYRSERLAAEPPHPSTSTDHAGFGTLDHRYEIGTGQADFETARDGLRHWQAHLGADMEVHPSGAPLAEGETVALLTRRLGLWVLAACRVETVIDEPTTFGFTYATLPDHPETGFESFTISLVEGRVDFAIEAVSKPEALLSRLGAPVSRIIQRQITDGYGRSLQRHVEADRAP